MTSSRLHANGGCVNQATLQHNTADEVAVTSKAGDTQIFTMQPGPYRRILDVKDSAGSDAMTYGSSDRMETSADVHGIASQYVYTDTDTTSYLSSLTEAVGTPQERKTTSRQPPDSARGVRAPEWCADAQAVESLVYDTDGRRTATCAADPAV